MNYLQAIIMGVIQGITELFPVSSLGHAILVPALVGGRWATDLSMTGAKSPYLAFIVGLHVATALALIVFFRRDWARIVGGLFSSLRHRRIQTASERLFWLLVIATIPVGLAGLLLEHSFRTVLGKPIPAAIFLIVNGLVLGAGELLRRRGNRIASESTGGPVRRGTHSLASEPAAVLSEADSVVDRMLGDDALADDAVLATVSPWRAVAIGAAQAFALLPGISRSGISMVGAMAAGLTPREAARFSFLLATPVILGAGLLKLPSLFGPLGQGIHGQVVAGSIAAFVAALLAVGFLDRFLRTRTLMPFAIYSAIAGAGSLVWLLVSK